MTLNMATFTVSMDRMRRICKIKECLIWRNYLKFDSISCSVIPVSMFGCGSAVMDNDSKLLVGEPSFKFSWAHYLHLRANTLWEDVDPTPSHPIMD